MHLVDVFPGMTEGEALKTYRESHPDAMENDTYVFSWITGCDREDIYARSGSSVTPVFSPELSKMVRELEQVSSPPVPAQDPDEDRVHRNNLDWIVESVDSPEPLPAAMQGRILKAAQIARSDMWRPRKKRY